MTILQFIESLSPEMYDSQISVMIADSRLVTVDIEDIISSEIHISLRSADKKEVVTAPDFLYPPQALQRFEIQDHSIRVMSIGMKELEDTFIPEDTRLLRRKQYKSMIEYGIYLKDIYSIRDLNWACHCFEIGIDFNRNEIPDFPSYTGYPPISAVIGGFYGI